MSIRQEAYRGMIIKADSFELVGIRRFISSLVILESNDPNKKLVDIPVTHNVFDDQERALEETIAHGRLLVDGLACEEGRNGTVFKKILSLKRRTTRSR
jgi:hypothetical protein